VRDDAESSARVCWVRSERFEHQHIGERDVGQQLKATFESLEVSFDGLVDAGATPGA